MDLERMSSIVKKLHAGASYTIMYESNGELKTRPARLGVRYSNTKHMAGLTAGPLPGNGRWVIDRYVYKDNNGFKLRITNGNFRWCKGKPIVQCIKLENVKAIFRKGEEL